MKLAKLLSNFNLFLHKISFDKHKPIRESVTNIVNEKSNEFYDYGEGFFYQSIPSINLKGLRNTEKRINKLKLSEYLNGKSFLDIGTNIGAIPISIENNFTNGVGIDHNPTLIKVANKVKDYFDIKNLRFIADDFIKYEFKSNFDVVLSLANHSTFDKGIEDSNKYFIKINNILNRNGILIVESHNPLYEKRENFIKIIDQLKKDYFILDNNYYDFGNFYDKDRLFYVMQKKN